MKLSFIVLCFPIFCSGLTGEYGLNMGGRSYPIGASIELFARTDYLLWDRRSESDFWKFGLIQPRLAVASHGLIEGTLSVFPISFVELGYAKSTTSRFLATKVVDCEVYLCKGNLQREKLFTKVSLAIGNFVALFGYSRIRLSMDDNSKMIFDEVENLILQVSGESTEALSQFFAYRQDTKIFGMGLRTSRNLASDGKNESQYLLYREKRPDYSFAVGLGRYASSLQQPGLSIVGNLSWSWGESRTLF